MKKMINEILSYRYLGNEYNNVQKLKFWIQMHSMKMDYVSIKRNHDLIHINKDNSTYHYLKNSVGKLEKLAMMSLFGDVNNILDIGANCGLFSFFCKKKLPQSKIFIIEPSPVLIPIINLNMKYFDNIQIDQLAISDKSNQDVTFFINENDQTTNSLMKSAVTPFTDDSTLKSNTVKTCALDDYIVQNNIDKIDLLKVDIQGCEELLINGGSKALEITSAAIFEISFLDPNVFNTVNKLLKYFPKYKTLLPVQYGADLLFYK